jgi:transcription antitermination factor NusG
MADQISFTPGETVKIISGPFAAFTGNIREVNQNRQMLLVIVRLESDNPRVKAGAGEIPIELSFAEVKKIAS